MVVVKLQLEKIIATSVVDLITATEAKSAGDTDTGYSMDSKDDLFDIKKTLNNDMEDEMDELW